MNLLSRVIVGDEFRRTRFHDEKGNRLGLRGMLHAPRVLIEAALRVSMGIRPERPWISFRAADEISSRIGSDWRLVEFGSGMSTLWFARRAGFLLSIEADRRWHEFVRERLLQKGLTNVRYELRSGEHYYDLSGFPDEYFDFCLVDGESRSRCVKSVVPKIRRGGLLYLDNTDKDTSGGDLRLAEAELIRAATYRGGSLQYFTDLAPSQLIAQQGLLARL